MTFVPKSAVLPRVLWRPALFFFAVAQIALAFAPLADAREAGDARAHVEVAGTALHHAHNEADCSACVARGLLSSSEAANARDDGIVAASLRTPAANVRFVASANPHDCRSRAPPLNRA